MIQNIQQWAVSTFGASKLGDKRRTNRLVKMACQLGENIGKSVVQSSEDSASIEGNYRLIRNSKISAQPIAESGFAATATLAQNYNEILALEDTTTLTYSRENMEDKLGYTSSSPNSKRRGILVHSVLLYAPEQQHTIGLIEQKRWVRDSAEFGKSKDRQNQAYEDKESYKWEAASIAMSKRLGDKMQHCISVCDREADIVEYMSNKSSNNERFVVRANFNRPLEEESRLYDYLTEQKKAGEYQVQVPQRGGRKGRLANMEIKYAPVSVMAPERKQKSYPPIKLYAVSCKEVKSKAKENEGKEGETSAETLHWTLLTTEPVESAEQALKIVSYYEARWKVELFHKVWKTQGTNVENLKMHQYQSLEKAAVILAFIACRLMQLKDMGENKDCGSAPCTLCLTTAQWKLLYKAIHKKKPAENEIPNVRWAYHSLGKLGKWNDSKRTGRVGWKALNEGLTKLNNMMEALELIGHEM
jgi:hypothetical protein